MQSTTQSKLETELSLNERLLSFNQLCHYLSISRQTAYNWIGEGVLKPKKIGGRVYFMGSDLLEILNKS